MKLSEIKPGKTYYHFRLEHFGTSSRGGKIKDLDRVNKYFVLEVREKSVLASCNGLPAQVYNKAFVSRWLKEKPTEEQILDRLKYQRKTPRRIE